MDKPTILKYEGLELPETLNYILDQDFWMLDNISGGMLTMLKAPMKFSSSTSIFVRKGSCKAEINLREYDITAPCMVNIASSKIMQPLSISDDFEGAFIVVSDRFIKDLLRNINDSELTQSFMQMQVLPIPTQYITDFELFYKNLRHVINDDANVHKYQTVLFLSLAFFYQTVLKCIKPSGKPLTTASYISTQFLKLAQENFKRERFLDFYATELQITPKHLSRTLKAQTGYTACEWLDRFILLEAKVLLKASNMNIQQIAEELNFPSQSFFGKYFKKNVGVSPKEYRNS